MGKTAKKTKQKGLSDPELVEKYEKGKAPMKTIIRRMVKTPAPGVAKRKEK